MPAMGRFDLMAGEADIALRLSFVDEHPDLISRPISTAQFALYGAPSYAQDHGLPTCPEDMPGHKLLVLRRDGVPPVIYNWFRRYVSEDQITRIYAEPGLLDTAVRSGQGLGINNLRMAAKDEAEGRLIRCFGPIPEITAKHQLLVSPAAWRRPEVKTFVRFFAPRYAALYT
jgi:DNA-binding transcriptional LysR family regulator